MIQNTPAHKRFIDLYLNWKLVQDRLSRYKHIRDAYPLDFLQSCSKSSPYYCHYLAWRLGTWLDDEFFLYFNDLLEFGASLENWKNNKSLLSSCIFDDFWGLLWQLQVAKFFSERNNSDTIWMKSGPDLRIGNGGNIFYVECYTYRKSFGINEFISELFHNIHPQIRVYHSSCIKFSLPRKGVSEIDYFLDQLFKPYLIPEFLATKLLEAQIEYPVLLPIPEGIENFKVYLEGDDGSKYVPDKNAAGSPELYLEHVIAEALNNKRNSNQLQTHRPNLLVVNYLLDTDFQMALNRQLFLSEDMPIPDISNVFDGVLIAACGINEGLSKSGFQVTARQNHPVSDLLRS